MQAFKAVTSRENPLIKQICALQSSAKARRESNSFVLEGLRLCSDASSNSIRFEKLVVSESALIKYEAEVSEFSKNSDECFVIPDSLFKKISDTTSPQGIIATAAISHKTAANIHPNGRYIALENIADPSNLGAIARTAEALGVSGIILSSSACDPYSPKALRASMGTLLRMPLIIFEDFAAEISKISLKSFASVVDKTAKSINDVSFGDGTVVIVGNEANGITENAASACDEKMTIPMSGRAESLNAAVAASILMWEMMK